MPHELGVNYAPVTSTWPPWNSVIWACIWVLSTHGFWVNTATQQVELTHVVPGCSADVVGSVGLGLKSVLGSIGIKSDLLMILRWSASDPSPCLIRDFLYTVEMNVERLWCVWVEHLLSACIVPIALDSHNCQCSWLGLGQQTCYVSDYFNTYHTQTIIGTASFLYLNPSTKALSLILYDYISNLPYHCTIQSLFDSLVWYNLLQVWLSLVDLHLPLYSLTLSLSAT